MSKVMLDAGGFQVACWDIPLPWTTDEDLPPSSDFDFEPDWDAAFDRPFPEDREWWARSCDERERLELSGPTDADWDEMARWCEWVDIKDGERLFTDEDARAASLAIG
jgi:hypothetical protein